MKTTSPSGREEVMRALLDAGTELLSHRAPSSVTLGEIAERAGVSRTLVHRHFGSKEGLLRAVMERGEAEMEGLFSADTDFVDTVVRTFHYGLERSLVIDVIAQALIDGVPGREIQSDSRMIRHLLVEFEAYRGASRRGEARGTVTETGGTDTEVAVGALPGQAAQAPADPRIVVAAISALTLGWTVFEDYLVHVTGLEGGERERNSRGVFADIGTLRAQ